MLRLIIIIEFLLIKEILKNVEVESKIFVSKAGS